MSLPEESVAANTLPEVTTIPTGKKLIFTDPDTNEGGIITLENLSKQILQNLTSQTFTLDQGNLTLLQALNQLNSKAQIEDISKSVTTNEDVTVTTASAVNIGNFTIIQFEINVLNTIPSRTQLIMNAPTRTPYTNMITGVVIENKSLENNYIYVDRYPNSVGGISIVTAKSLPTGNYRGNVAFISTSK